MSNAPLVSGSPGKTIDSLAGGVGDLALALWISEGARRAGERISFVEQGRADIVRAFGHLVVERQSEDCMVLGTKSKVYEDELRTSDVDRSPRAIRWQRSVGWNFDAVRPTLKFLPDDSREWARSFGGDGPLIVIAPKAHWQTRTMEVQKWLRVAWALHKAGIKVIAVDGEKEVVETFPLYAFGFGWNHLMALMERATVVAGNDSGITHLASTIGVPTVAAMGPTDPAIVFGHAFDRVRCVRTSLSGCVGCHFSGCYGYQKACDYGCEALDLLSWREVCDAIMFAFEYSQSDSTEPINPWFQQVKA